MTAATAGSPGVVQEPRPGPDGPPAVGAVPLDDRRRAGRRPGSSTASRSRSCPRSAAILQDKGTLGAEQRRRSACSARSTCSARWSARWSSAGSPTGSAASKLFIMTLALYLVGQRPGRVLVLELWFLLLFRFVAGLGIGGEYTAINSAIDELIPSHYRGRVDIAVNGTYWAGAAIGAAASTSTCYPDHVPLERRLAHRLLHRPGARPGHHLPAPAHPREPALADDPRPQRRGRAHRRRDRGAGARTTASSSSRCDESKALEVSRSRRISYAPDRRGLLRHVPAPLHPRLLDDGDAGVPLQRDLLQLRAGAGALLQCRRRQASAYYFFPFAIGNLLGPLLLGPLFDTVGRRKMILFTYGSPASCC